MSLADKIRALTWDNGISLVWIHLLEPGRDHSESYRFSFHVYNLVYCVVSLSSAILVF